MSVKIYRKLRLPVKEFDIVMMIGVLHHLTDEQCERCLCNIAKIIEKRGRFVSIDPIRRENQPFFERTLVNLDRGKYVRYEDEYVELLRKYLPDIQYDIRHDLHRFPYTHIIFHS